MKRRFIGIRSWGDREPYYWTTYHVHWREFKYCTYNELYMWNNRGWNFRVPKPINHTLRFLFGHNEYKYDYKVMYPDGGTQGYGTGWILKKHRDVCIDTGEDVLSVKMADKRRVYNGWKFKGWAYLWYRTKNIFGINIYLCKKGKR
jgi:hypothetical protein